MVTRAAALPGRAAKMTVSAKHYVLFNQMEAPFPEQYKKVPMHACSPCSDTFQLYLARAYALPTLHGASRRRFLQTDASGVRRKAHGGFQACSRQLADTLQVSPRTQHTKRCAADRRGTLRRCRSCTTQASWRCVESVPPHDCQTCSTETHCKVPISSRTFCAGSGSRTTLRRACGRETIGARSIALGSTGLMRSRRP